MFARGDGGGCLWWSSHLPMVRTERSCMSPAALARSGRWMISPWGTVSSIATSPCALQECQSLSYFDERELKKEHRPRKSHDTPTLAPAPPHHATQERHTDARCVPSHLRSALGYRDRGVLPRAVRQDPPQPRSGEQVVEGRLQACRCVPSQVRLRRVPGHGLLGRGVLVSYACWTTTKLCLYPTRESLDFLVKLRKYVCDYAARRGSVRLLKWARVNNL